MNIVDGRKGSQMAQEGWQAEFSPEAWINDYAVSVDPAGETTWKIDAAEAAQCFQNTATPGTDVIANRDALREHPNAPQWVKEWSGPFEIRLINPDGDTL